MAVPLLLACWACAFAQSLGTPAADVLLGQPLEMTVPARFASADAGDECVHADVFFGESRVRADSVRTTVVGPGDQRRIRIETDRPVDEPVVTVSLRAGCRNTVTRNYTLLPEFPSQTAIAGLVGRASNLASIPGGNTGSAPLRLARSPAAADAQVAARTPVARPAASVQARESAPPRTRTARAFRKEAVAGGPRLRLEPLEALEPEAQKLLRVSNSLADPNGDVTRRATAALLWKAINADPQELLRTSAMLQKLESDLTQLRQTSAQTRNEMLALRARLDQAQPWYVSAPLVQGLALLVLAAATAAAVLWYRTRRLDTSGPWYAAGKEPLHEPAADSMLPADVDVVTEVAPQPVVTRRDAGVPPGGIAPTAPATHAPLRTARPVRDEPVALDFEVPVPQAEGAPRRSSEGVLRVETLAATFEEVEFLSSLGLSSDAMDVLKAYLQDSSSPAPVAFFELMRLCEQSDDPSSVATVRRRYAKVFGVEPPRLEQVAAPTGLESMADLSGRITRAWGTREAMELIEETLFKVATPGATLTLQAGRDLICLYDLAMALVTEAATAQAANSDADAHPLAPWAAIDDPAAAHAAAQAAADANGGRSFALDVDLTAAPAPLQASVTERKDNEDSGLAPLIAGFQAAAAREEAARTTSDDEDAFSAAVASERVPVSRF